MKSPAWWILLAVLCATQPAAARWESAQDNKSVDELQQMANDQLFNEAFDVCVRRALLENNGATDPTAEASAYLNTIYPFVREKNGGNSPAWMTELFTAHSIKECQHAFHSFVSNGPPPHVAKSIHQKKMKSAASTTGPSHWTEELPPWFAPH